MTYSQRKEELLKKQIIPQTMEDDFEEFWNREIQNLRSIPLKVERELMDLPYKTFSAYKIQYNTHDETVVTAYLCVPNTYCGKPLPCVAVYHGGGGHFGIFPDIAATGVCTFSMDTRSQGGKTYDHARYDLLRDYHGGVMTHGYMSPDNFYMRNLYLDAVRAIDVITTLPEVDPECIVSYGVSQGGALSIVAAAFSGKVKKAYPCVPSYCCIEKRVEAGSGVFDAVKNHLRRYPEDTDQVMKTLSYFDINNIVSLLKVPVDFFLGLGDPTCLPSFVYSPYAHTKSEKKITLSPFTPHEVSREYKLSVFREFAALVK